MKTILMLPSWYPTKENPFNGSFFREQALVMDGIYNFIVLHVCFKRFVRKPFLELIKEEYNVKEYNLVLNNSYAITFKKKKWAVKNALKPASFVDGIGSIFPPFVLKDLRKQISNFLSNNSDFNYDFVYGLPAQDMAINCKIFSEARNKPLVLAEHGPFPWPGKTINNETKNALETCDEFIAISNDKIRQVLLQNIKLKHISYLINFVDESKFFFNKTEHPVKTFIIVAANSFYKQFDMYIKVFNRLTEITTVPFKAMVVGFNADKKYAKEPQELIDKLNNSKFADKLELIDSVPRNELPAVYNRADCFIMTSIQEGQPVSALEAGCCGLPIFSTRCGGVEDYVNDSIGRIYNITDYVSFADGLKQFLEGDIKFDNRAISEYMISLCGTDSFKNNFSRIFESVAK